MIVTKVKKGVCVCGKINAPRHKIIFKSLHMLDYKIIQQEAEHTPMQVI